MPSVKPTRSQELSEVAVEPSGSSFLIKWDDFRDHDIIEMVDSISRFYIAVQFPQFTAFRDDAALADVQDVLFEATYDVLQKSKLLRFDDLTRVASSDGIAVKYGDADNEFHVEFTRGSELRIVRNGSSFERFYGWYASVMPHVPHVVDQTRRHLERRVRPGHEAARYEPARARYVFTFILHSFQTGQRKRSPIPNSHIVRKILTQVPGPDGNLVALDEAQYPDLGRLDVSISRWRAAPGGRVREVYDIQAPGNRNYGTLWFELSYIAETPTDHAESEATLGVLGSPNPLRIASRSRGQPDFEQFLDRFDLPLLDFVRERALVNLLASLTDGMSFKATPGQIP